eukprot:m.182112 g.182112  ORF g.182112 m.182112 type:complete len:117 (+) comp39285_c0_seq27:144-494(+)
MKCMKIACSKGNLPVVRHLIEEGCSLKEGWSWLHLACVSGQPEIALFLIDAGVGICEDEQDGMTLFLASCEGAEKSPDGDMKFVPVVECLLSKGCILGRRTKEIFCTLLVNIALFM